MDDLKFIKKHYGEKMAQLCRELFPTILETPGKLKRIMEASFYPTKNLYYSIIINEEFQDGFVEFINSKINKKEKILLETEKDPFELMEEAGYILTECKTEEEIQSFRKFYKLGEKLCTFDGGRLNSCYVFFAVKKDVDKIKRENFNKPRREDEYGTSVISIQFSKNNYTLSIKNRYNHTVINPDATFGNNLENIIPGLTRSFEKYYGFKVKQNEEGFEIPGYTEVDGKYYKYNYEINNIYYCPNNIIIINGEVKQYKPEQYIIMDYYILDLKNKTLTLVNKTISDGFIEEYKDIKDIQIKKEDTQKKIIITTKDGKQSIITINNQNQIICYENNHIDHLHRFFMYHNKTLNELKLDNLVKMDDFCFKDNDALKELFLPKLKEMGGLCFCSNNCIEKLELPALELMDSNCFEFNDALKKLFLPKLKKMGWRCFNSNDEIDELELPVLESMGRECFMANGELKKLSLPKLEIMGETCFYHNKEIEDLRLPKLKEMGFYCFVHNQFIEKLELPNLEKMGKYCFEHAPLEEVIAPNLTECKDERIQEFIERTRKK